MTHPGPPTCPPTEAEWEYRACPPRQNGSTPAGEGPPPPYASATRSPPRKPTSTADTPLGMLRNFPGKVGAQSPTRIIAVMTGSPWSPGPHTALRRTNAGVCLRFRSARVPRSGPRWRRSPLLAGRPSAARPGPSAGSPRPDPPPLRGPGRTAPRRRWSAPRANGCPPPWRWWKRRSARPLGWRRRGRSGQSGQAAGPGAERIPTAQAPTGVTRVSLLAGQRLIRGGAVPTGPPLPLINRAFPASSGRSSSICPVRPRIPICVRRVAPVADVGSHRPEEQAAERSPPETEKRREACRRCMSLLHCLRRPRE
jgi:hypothetical protein